MIGALVKRYWLQFVVITLIVVLAFFVNHYRDNAITYKDQRDKATVRADTSEAITSNVITMMNLIRYISQVNADGSLLLKTYHRTHPDAPAFARNEIDGVSDGDPFDIPRDQFVSVRVEMPADSLYNQKIRAAELAMTADAGE